MAETIERGTDARGNAGNFSLRRVSARREGGLQPSRLGTGRRERCRSQDIVVSARGWLVVNPIRSS